MILRILYTNPYVFPLILHIRYAIKHTKNGICIRNNNTKPYATIAPVNRILPLSTNVDVPISSWASSYEAQMLSRLSYS